MKACGVEAELAIGKAFLCPFHAEKSPSFTVDDRRGTFHCFGCGAHGGVIDFLMRHDGLAFLELSMVTLSVVGMVFAFYVGVTLRARRLITSAKAVQRVNRGSSVVMAGAAIAIATR